MKRFSMQTKLMVGFSLILVTSLLGPYLFYAQTFRSALEREALNSATTHLDLAVATLETRSPFAGPEDLNRKLAKLGEATGIRVTYIAAGGEVVADSGLNMDQIAVLDNHATRPEVVQARQTGTGIAIRYSGTLDKNLIYAARPLDSLDGIPAGILRVAVPYAETNDILERMNRSMLGFMAASLLIFFVLTGVLMNRVLSSLRQVVDNVLAIGAGDYDKRIRDVPSPEFVPLVKAVNYLAQNIGENISTITRQKVELEAVFNGMREGVMILDDQMRVVGSNQSLQRIFPRLEAQPGLSPLEATLIPELQDACALIQETGFDEGSNRTVSLVVKTNAGAYFDVNIVPLHGYKDLGAVVVFHDVSEIKRAENMRKDFVGNVSHELRTPLTSIKGYAETLQSLPECEGEDLQSFLGIILKNADIMNQMLGDLLALAKYESGEIEPDRREVDLYSAAYSALKICQPQVEAKAVSVDLRIVQGQKSVWADFDQLVQVLVNLIGNAVKYVPEQSGRIRIEIVADGDMVEVAVTDNGPGIPTSDLHRVFERFYRVEKHRSRDVPGTGLGLAICRHIVLNHGGRIWVESPAPGMSHGSVFHFELPSAASSGEKGSL
ncbi:MAG: HAMP domain-containing histidine kinase [Deltaproteobacteria bacterium]|nr:HAMP domain-containing histidine kinase [Deltaproteobacteria bacterium]